MKIVDLVSEGWDPGPVSYASSFLERLRGLIGRRDRAMVLRGRSVHGIGIGRPMTVVGLATDGTVIGCRTLVPGRLVVMRRARWMLELDRSIEPPGVGSVVGPLPPRA